jgi:hypothetical protein
MSVGGLSRGRLGRLRDVMAGHVERGVLMTQRAWTSPSPPDVCRDFWTATYQALDD